jgi:hypothetical protein
MFPINRKCKCLDAVVTRYFSERTRSLESILHPVIVDIDKYHRQKLGFFKYMKK